MCASDRYENKITPQIKCTSACLPVCQGDFLAKLNRIYWKIVPGLRFLLPKQGEMNTFRFPPHFRRRYPFYREAILDILSPRRNHENRENVLCARNSKLLLKIVSRATVSWTCIHTRFYLLMSKVNDKLMNKDIKCIIWSFSLVDVEVGWLHDSYDTPNKQKSSWTHCLSVDKPG